MPRPGELSAAAAPTIRPATAEDAAAIFAVTRDSVAALASSHYGADQIAGWMGDRTPATYLEGVGRIRVAERGGRVVGYVDAVPGEITRLFLLPEAAGQGLGRALLREGLAMAQRGHAGPLRVEATLNAVPFYARFGFREVGRGHFGGRGGDFPPLEVVIMERAPD